MIYAVSSLSIRQVSCELMPIKRKNLSGKHYFVPWSITVSCRSFRDRAIQDNAMLLNSTSVKRTARRGFKLPIFK